MVKTIDELFDWTDLTTDGEQRSIPLTERGGDVFFVIHHAYNRRVQDTIALSKPGGRTVSMSSALGPTTAGVQAPIFNVQVVRWNTRRPWTTSSSIDDKAYTVECSNVDLNYPYPVAQAIKQRLAEIAAALHVQCGMPLDTWHILDHAEVHRRGWGSYPTACCGDDLRAAIGWIIAEAKRIVAAGGGTGGAEVRPYNRTDPIVEKSGKTLAPGSATYLTNADAKTANLVGVVGQYSITTIVYATGTPGDVVDFLLQTDDVNTSGAHVNHHSQREVFDKDGFIRSSVEFKLPVVGGNAIYLRVNAPATNKDPFKLTRLRTNGFQFSEG